MNRIQLQTSIEKYLPVHLKNEGYNPTYGTAGFRDAAGRLPGIVFRCGLLVAARALATGKHTGIMITASHNPVADNGVKLVEPDGSMLIMDWEVHANALAAADDAHGITDILMNALGPQTAAGDVRVVVLCGHDTRPSAPALVQAATDGIQVLCKAVNVGLVTTPQLHWMVWKMNDGQPHGESDYYYALLGAFEEIVEGTAPASKELLHIDGANGVGAVKLAHISDRLQRAGLPIQLHNTGEGVLNGGCGADYVQKEQRPPCGFDGVPPGSRCASMDGDADRLVYFIPDGNGVRLYDGDRVAALAAKLVMKMMKACGEELAGVTVGIVQTAYANGASTAFLSGVLGCEVVFRPTGVKHMHHAAQQFDVGLYWEANGHGTMLFKPQLLQRLETLAPTVAAARQLLALSRMVNQAVGDAISGILLVEAALRLGEGGTAGWGALYTDLPSRQLKVVVPDRSVIRTVNAERQVDQPQGLQQKIDECVSRVSEGRSFVRPSGTEDIVRVYAEAGSREEADALAQAVSQVVHQHLGCT